MSVPNRIQGEVAPGDDAPVPASESQPRMRILVQTQRMVQLARTKTKMFSPTKPSSTQTIQALMKMAMATMARNMPLGSGQNARRGTLTPDLSFSYAGLELHPILGAVVLAEQHCGSTSRHQFFPRLAKPRLSVRLAGERLVGAADRTACRVLVSPHPRHCSLALSRPTLTMSLRLVTVHIRAAPL